MTPKPWTLWHGLSLLITTNTSMQTAMHQKSCFSLSVSSCLPRGGFPPLLVEPPRGPWGDAQEVSLPDTSPTNEPCLSPEPRQLVFIPVFAQRPTVSKDVLLQLLGTSLFVFPFPFYFYFIFFWPFGITRSFYHHCCCTHLSRETLLLVKASLGAAHTFQELWWALLHPLFIPSPTWWPEGKKKKREK